MIKTIRGEDLAKQFEERDVKEDLAKQFEERDVKEFNEGVKKFLQDEDAPENVHKHVHISVRLEGV